MKNLKKKQVKTFDIQYLIKELRSIEQEIYEKFPFSHIDFNIGDAYLKKYDIESFAKMKDFVTLLQNLLTVIQEFRSRGFSLVDISDFENNPMYVNRILQYSFVEKEENK